MRHTGFRRLMVVNGTPGFWGVTETLGMIRMHKSKKLGLSLIFDIFQVIAHTWNLRFENLWFPKPSNLKPYK